MSDRWRASLKGWRVVAMPRLQVPPDIGIALMDSRAVVLDVAADRYLQLGGRLAAALGAISRALASEDRNAVAALLDAGYVVESDAVIQPIRLPIRPARALPIGIASVADLAFVALAAATLRTVAALRVHGFARTIDNARARKSRHPRLIDDEEAAVRVALAFAGARLAIPIKRVCLPDALTLFRLLTDSGIESSFVIGVKLDPFAAHSWVQTNATLLTDDLDVVAELTPIFAI